MKRTKGSGRRTNRAGEIDAAAKRATEATGVIRRRRLLGVAILVLIAALSALVYVKIGAPLSEFVSDTAAMRAWVASKGWSARLIFGTVVCLQVIVAVIPGEPLELSAGYAFGPLEGSLICLGGIFVGSVIVFLLARRFGRKFVLLFVTEEKLKSVRFLQDSDKLFLITAILMICPGTPKDLLTYCAGLTPIPLAAWIAICSFGRIPSVVTSTWGGHALAEGDYLQAGVIFGVTALLCAGGIALFRRYQRRHKSHARQPKGSN